MKTYGEISEIESVQRNGSEASLEILSFGCNEVATSLSSIVAVVGGVITTSIPRARALSLSFTFGLMGVGRAWEGVSAIGAIAARVRD